MILKHRLTLQKEAAYNTDWQRITGIFLARQATIKLQKQNQIES
jgi:hypothetical protein